MDYNRKFDYVMNNRPVEDGETNVFNLRPEKDFHCFDIAGVPDESSIEKVTIDIFFPSRPISNISSEPISAPLLATQAPGDSSWLFPFYLPKNDVMTVSVENGHSSDFDFDLGFFGYHREPELPLAGCPPDKSVYYYVLNYGTVAGNAQGVREHVRINSNYAFVAMGVVATPNASLNDRLEYKWEIDSRSERWMKDYIFGSALFQNPAATPRRIMWRIPQLFQPLEEISLYCNNTTGTSTADTQIAIFGYHVPRGTTINDVMRDMEVYKRADLR